MPARPISSGNVSFGLVSIPVKLYSSADHSSDIRFNWLDAKHGVRLKQQYISSKDERVVPPEERIKGYEFAKGQYVTFTDEELQKMAQKASPTIDITEFVPIAEVDPVYFERAYFLGPETGGEKAYRLLCEAMKKTSRCALAKYATRGKQYLVLLRPFAEGLILQQLYYHDEIRAFDEVPLGEEVDFKKGELDLAVQLIEQIANDAFEPQRYEDEVRGRIWAQIQKKVEGEEITATLEEEPKAQIVDLMEALKASLGVDDEAGAESGKRKARKSPRGSKSRARKAASK